MNPYAALIVWTRRDPASTVGFVLRCSISGTTARKRSTRAGQEAPGSRDLHQWCPTQVGGSVSPGQLTKDGSSRASRSSRTRPARGGITRVDGGTPRLRRGLPQPSPPDVYIWGAPSPPQYGPSTRRRRVPQSAGGRDPTCDTPFRPAVQRHRFDERTHGPARGPADLCPCGPGGVGGWVDPQPAIGVERAAG